MSVLTKILGGAWVGAISLCPATSASAQDASSPVRVGAEEPTVLGSDPVMVDLFNDTGESIPIVAIDASVRPTNGDASNNELNVPVEVDLGSGFGPLQGGAALAPASQALVQLARPSDASAPAIGWLRVVVRLDGTTRVVRHELRVAAPPAGAGVTAWTVTSTQYWPNQHDGGQLGNPIPLASGTDCSAVGTPAGFLVAGDDVVSVSSSCEQGRVTLSFGSIPRAGSYEGTLKVGDTDVELELRRSFVLWWPVILILAGFVVALWAQGRLNQGWRGQQRWWLSRLPVRAARADEQFKTGANGRTWETYRLAPAVSAQAEELKSKLEAIAKARSPLIRFLPWPDGYAQAERDAIRKEITKLDSLIARWPEMPEALNAAHERIFAEPYYLARAPQLSLRTQQTLAPGNAVLSVKEIESRRLEIEALPDALTLIDQVEELDKYLRALEGEDKNRPSADLETVVRARQLERQVSAVLRQVADARTISTDLATTVRLASRLASRLPPPRRVPVEGEVVTEAHVAAPEEVRLSILSAIRRLVSTAADRRLEVGHTAMIVLSLAVGVWSGLVALYNGKTWGESLGDFIAAFVWGFGASVLLAPVVTAIKQLGTRPSDQDSAVSGMTAEA